MFPFSDKKPLFHVTMPDKSSTLFKGLNPDMVRAYSVEELQNSVHINDSK